MKNISDDLLIESIQKAKDINLDPEFIYLLHEELKERQKKEHKKNTPIFHIALCF